MSPDRAGWEGRSPRLGGGAEFRLVERILEGNTLPDDVVVGPGDDAVAFEDGLVVSTDVSVEDVHFRLAWMDARAVGYRAVTAALSDLAAMAAAPRGVLVSLAFPDGGDPEATMAGAREACAAAGTHLVGGDLSRSPGPLVVDVTVLGRAERPARRAGVRAGDELWVTGRLGGSAGAVRLLEAGEEPGGALRAVLERPTARIPEARALAAAGLLGGCIDVSDGLAGDAGHLAAASGVRVVLEAGAVPVHPALGARFAGDEALELALHGGEDYEILFSTRPSAPVPETLSPAGGAPATRVGRAEPGEGVWLRAPDGIERRLERGGFSHVRGDEP